MKPDLVILESVSGECGIFGPETDDSSDYRRALVPSPQPRQIYLPYLSRAEAEQILERMQQLEACSLLDLDHCARPGTWGTVMRMPVQFADMRKA